MNATTAPGFFGKLPARGDFVEQRLGKDFVAPWDDWLQQSIAASQAQLGNDWLNAYLTSPLWRFVISKGVLGRNVYIGVTMPSVDKVGRYFPLTIAVQAEGEPDPFSLLIQCGAWFAEAEDVLLSVLDDPPISLESFDDKVARLELGSIGEESPAGFSGPADFADMSNSLFQFSIRDQSALTDTMCPLLAAAIENSFGPYAIMSTSGSDRVGSSLLLSAGLPRPNRFAALLDGAWSEHGWLSQDLSHQRFVPEDQCLEPPCSAGMTDPGHVREVNQDAFSCHDDLRLWIVADGLGGHQAGELASALVVQAVNDLPENEALTVRVETIKRRLRLVQSTLHQVGNRYEDVANSASTVVVLLFDEARAACLWAGDSRIYRLRRGKLEQLTSDHDDTGDDDVAAESNVVTRAVGGEEALQVDVLYESLDAGDRFLLCSDGVYRELPRDELIALLGTGSPKDACSAIRDAVLETDAQDNLTAVVVDIPLPDPVSMLIETNG